MKIHNSTIRVTGDFYTCENCGKEFFISTKMSPAEYKKFVSERWGVPAMVCGGCLAEGVEIENVNFSRKAKEQRDREEYEIERRKYRGIT